MSTGGSFLPPDMQLPNWDMPMGNGFPTQNTSGGWQMPQAPIMIPPAPTPPVSTPAPVPPVPQISQPATDWNSFFSGF